MQRILLGIIAYLMMSFPVLGSRQAVRQSESKIVQNKLLLEIELQLPEGVVAKDVLAWVVFPVNTGISRSGAPERCSKIFRASHPIFEIALDVEGKLFESEARNDAFLFVSVKRGVYGIKNIPMLHDGMKIVLEVQNHIRRLRIHKPWAADLLTSAFVPSTLHGRPIPLSVLRSGRFDIRIENKLLNIPFNPDDPVTLISSSANGKSRFLLDVDPGLKRLTTKTDAIGFEFPPVWNVHIDLAEFPSLQDADVVCRSGTERYSGESVIEYSLFNQVKSKTIRLPQSTQDLKYLVATIESESPGREMHLPTLKSVKGTSVSLGIQKLMMQPCRITWPKGRLDPRIRKLTFEYIVDEEHSIGDSQDQVILRNRQHGVLQEGQSRTIYVDMARNNRVWFEPYGESGKLEVLGGWGVQKMPEINPGGNAKEADLVAPKLTLDVSDKVSSKRISVVARNSGKPIHKARVSASIGKRRRIFAYTDKHGIATLDLPQQFRLNVSTQNAQKTKEQDGPEEDVIVVEL